MEYLGVEPRWTLYFYGGNQFSVYGVGGINITGVHWKAEYESTNFSTGQKETIKDSDSDTEFGLNLGGGGQYDINEKIALFGELKYVISSYDQLVFTFGIVSDL